MKLIYISLDDLDSSLPRIWEMCAEHQLKLQMTPYADHIAIFKGEEKIAEILVINITSPYDIAELVLNK